MGITAVSSYFIPYFNVCFIHWNTFSIIQCTVYFILKVSLCFYADSVKYGINIKKCFNLYSTMNRKISTRSQALKPHTRSICTQVSSHYRLFLGFGTFTKPNYKWLCRPQFCSNIVKVLIYPLIPTATAHTGSQEGITGNIIEQLLSVNAGRSYLEHANL